MADASSGEPFRFGPDPDAPGWLVGRPRTGRFIDIFGTIGIRVESDRVTRVRLTPGPQHRNLLEAVHGGFLMAVVDQVLFLGPIALGMRGARGAVTISTSTEFFAPVGVDRPFEAVVEVLRETGRMVFLRGLIEQDGIAAVSFSGTIRKASPPPAAP